MTRSSRPSAGWGTPSEVTSTPVPQPPPAAVNVSRRVPYETEIVTESTAPPGQEWPSSELAWSLFRVRTTTRRLPPVSVTWRFHPSPPGPQRLVDDRGRGHGGGEVLDRGTGRCPRHERLHTHVDAAAVLHDAHAHERLRLLGVGREVIVKSGLSVEVAGGDATEQLLGRVVKDELLDDGRLARHRPPLGHDAGKPAEGLGEVQQRLGDGGVLQPGSGWQVHQGNVPGRSAVAAAVPHPATASAAANDPRACA